jgi:hypothetical protein
LRYLFEDCAFETNLRELHRGADVVGVVDRARIPDPRQERVISKDDPINAIWNGRIVSDAALTTRLNAARSAIGCESGQE